MTKGVSSLRGIADAGKEMFGFRSVSVMLVFYCPFAVFSGTLLSLRQIVVTVFLRSFLVPHCSPNLTDLATSFLLQSPTSPTSSSPQNNAAKPASMPGAPAWWRNSRSKQQNRQKLKHPH